jgi:NAD(P)H dehydrogenase (quinone)
MAKKIFVLLGNPDKESFTGELSGMYEQAAREAGHEVRRMNIGDMDFDPVLHKGYKEIQELEQPLKDMQENINWCDHLVVIYPNWWCSMPAKLKGMFDRAWLPGFAFNFDKETKAVIQRLTGKTARVIVVAGTQSPFMTWWKYGDFTNEISRGILGFAGMHVAVSTFGPCDTCTAGDRESWKTLIKTLGKNGT